MPDLYQHFTAGRAIDTGIVLVVAAGLLWMVWPSLNSSQQIVAVPVITLLSALWVFAVGWIFHRTGRLCKRLAAGFGNNVS